MKRTRCGWLEAGELTPAIKPFKTGASVTAHMAKITSDVIRKIGEALMRTFLTSTEAGTGKDIKMSDAGDGITNPGIKPGTNYEKEQ